MQQTLTTKNYPDAIASYDTRPGNEMQTYSTNSEHHTWFKDPTAVWLCINTQTITFSSNFTILKTWKTVFALHPNWLCNLRRIEYTIQWTSRQKMTYIRPKVLHNDVLC